METINDRMEMLVNERFNGNKAAFAKAIGTERATLSNYIGSVRRSKPSVDMVAKIVTALDVDARWLLCGEGASTTNAKVETNGDFSPASVHGNVSVETDAVLAERIKSLEALLAEKERLIKVYERMVEK
ncbi:MAG: helix-turn-helix transcriptional regulator [Prevotella sp.]|nr:helix-turn-helix transcriptional regulator [Prevotella sp.]MDY3620151.1 helix-turn-helix transcriptional regulator [Prevotella sp.]